MHDIWPGTEDAIVNKGLLDKLEEWGYKYFYALPKKGDPKGSVIGKIK
jgi:hypothetical protein